MAIIRLTTCNSSIEATMTKNILENEGIECFLTNENFTTLMPGHIGMLGSGVQVMIDAEDYEKASSIVALQEKEDVLVCPNCGSEDVVFGLGEHKVKKVFLVMLSLLFFIPFNNIRNLYYCKHCKSEFKKEPLKQ